MVACCKYDVRAEILHLTLSTLLNVALQYLCLCCYCHYLFFIVGALLTASVGCT